MCTTDSEGVTMFVTSLSVPGVHLKCDVKVGASLEEKLRYSWMLMSNLAMSINGVRTCGGKKRCVALLTCRLHVLWPHCNCDVVESFCQASKTRF